MGQGSAFGVNDPGGLMDLPRWTTPRNFDMEKDETREGAYSSLGQPRMCLFPIRKQQVKRFSAEIDDGWWLFLIRQVRGFCWIKYVAMAIISHCGS